MSVFKDFPGLENLEKKFKDFQGSARAPFFCERVINTWNSLADGHRRTRLRGWAGRQQAPILTRAKPLFFGQKLNFSGRSQQPKVIFLYLLNEKTEFIPSSQMQCPKSGIFTNNYWVG